MSHFIAVTTTTEAATTRKVDETATTIEGMVYLFLLRTNIELA